VIAAVLGGTVADLDRLSALAGPAAYFAAYRTYTHSLLAAVMIAAAAAGVSPFLLKKKGSERGSFPRVCAATLVAALLHLAMDLCQSDGAAPAWPFRGTRSALDWIAGFDLWILAALLAGVLVPALLRLVTEEIGARSKGPRGRGGAVFALSAIAIYAGGRAMLHADAVAALEARTYRGESPRRAGAFAESYSVFEWRGIVETDRAIYQSVVPTGPGARFDPDAAVAMYKPEASAVLEAARESAAARRFLAVARFPKATIERTTEGYRCGFRDLRFAAAGETERAVSALVVMGEDGKVRESEIVWERKLRR
jgi:membrane-bound metal-dependent hydrolase YbcI (DUF457 family)